MTWICRALRYPQPDASTGEVAPCQCPRFPGAPHPPAYEAEWLLVETGEIVRRNVCRPRAGQIAAEFNLHPMPFGPGITEARVPAAERSH